MGIITTFTVDDFEGLMIEWVKIEETNGSFVCMSKINYDEMIANQAAHIEGAK